MAIPLVRRLRLSPAGDEGRQAIDVAWLFLKTLRLHLRTRRVGLLLTVAVIACVTTGLGLHLARRVGCVLTAREGGIRKQRLTGTLLFRVFKGVFALFALGPIVGLGLAELLLGSRNQPEIVFSVLEV